MMVDGRKITGDVAFHNEKGEFRSGENSGDSPLATVQAKPPQAVCIRVLRKPIVQLGAQEPVEEQINEPFFPGINIESAALAAEVAMQCDSRSKRKRFPSKRAVNLREVVQARTSKVIKIAFVSRGEQGLAPGEKWLRVEPNGRFVEIGFAIQIGPAELRAIRRIDAARDVTCRVLRQSGRILEQPRI